MIDVKALGEFIQTHLSGCGLVGVSSDNEVFLEFDREDAGLEFEVSRIIKESFPESSKVVTVVRPSISQMTAMVNELNIVLGESENETPEKPLLQIEDFDEE